MDENIKNDFEFKDIIYYFILDDAKLNKIPPTTKILFISNLFTYDINICLPHCLEYLFIAKSKKEQLKRIKKRPFGLKIFYFDIEHINNFGDVFIFYDLENNILDDIIEMTYIHVLFNKKILNKKFKLIAKCAERLTIYKEIDENIIIKD